MGLHLVMAVVYPLTEKTGSTGVDDGDWERVALGSW